MPVGLRKAIQIYQDSTCQKRIDLGKVWTQSYIYRTGILKILFSNGHGSTEITDLENETAQGECTGGNGTGHKSRSTVVHMEKQYTKNQEMEAKGSFKNEGSKLCEMMQKGRVWWRLMSLDLGINTVSGKHWRQMSSDKG